MAPLFVASLSDDDAPPPAVVRDSFVHRVPGASSVRAMLGDWDGWLSRIESGQLEDPLALADCTLLPPIGDPPNIYMAGANYADHAREMRDLAPEVPVPRHPRGAVFL